jgi:uncharacterized surface protein with fasciclin (FAS1) repeats
VRLIRSGTIAAVALALPLGLAACGGNSNASEGAGSSSPSSASSPMASSPTSDGMTADAASSPFGAACSAVPKDGKGSFAGMATDPVATAAGNNPVLSQLVGAVKAAGLVDTLNSAHDITVFAPTNDAFKSVPTRTMDELAHDPARLKAVLSYHVVPARLSASDVKNGNVKTAQGANVAVFKAGETVTVEDAMVQRADIMATNGVVHTVDRVLMPPKSH